MATLEVPLVEAMLDPGPPTLGPPTFLLPLVSAPQAMLPPLRWALKLGAMQQPLEASWLVGALLGLGPVQSR